jgi:hypothetical protein
MPDWKSEASRKLEGAKFSASERDDVSSELAGYLEDLCNESRASGADESSAVARAARELHEDPHVGTNLARARKENTMNDRTKRLWLPAITLLLSTIALLMLFEIPGLSDPDFSYLVWLRDGAPNWRLSFWSVYGTYNFGWLCILPFVGTAGAYWSRRAGSGPAMQAAAGLSPLLLFLAMFAVNVYYGFVHDGVAPANQLAPMLAVNALRWVVFPGVALFLGVFPFLCRDSYRGRDIVSSM